MKKISFTFLLVWLWAIKMMGQAVPNPSFELWQSDTLNRLGDWFDSNFWAQVTVGSPNVTRSSDAHDGQYAVRMTSRLQGTDSVFGYIGMAPLGSPQGQGGFPFTETPDTLSGWMKCNLQGGDSAIIGVTFKSGGTIIGNNLYFLTGTVSNWTHFSMPITTGGTPDTALVAAISARPGGGSLTDGSWIMLDGLSFNTPTPIPNGGFENWATDIRTEPSGWSSPDSYGDTSEVVTQTTDALQGDYAVRIETQSLFGGSTTMGYLTSGQFNGPSQTGGRPYTLTTDTLCGFYKYAGIAGDSGVIGAVFYQNGVMLAVAATMIHDEGSYTYFEVPFQLPSTPDTVRIDIWSSHPGGLPMAGSVLIVDSLRFKSDPLVGVPVAAPGLKCAVHPNPSNGISWLEMQAPEAGEYQIRIHSVSGELVMSRKMACGAGYHQTMLDLQSLPRGIYTMQIVGPGLGGHMKIVLE